MYQISLTWFISLFTRSIEESEKANEVEHRLLHISQHLTSAVFTTISSFLYRRHRLLFSFLLSACVCRVQGELAQDYFDFFIHGSSPADAEITDSGAPVFDESERQKLLLHLENNRYQQFTHLFELPNFSFLLADFKVTLQFDAEL